LHIAYFINQYPKVSHSFIRREILALERQGFQISRFALRGWDAVLVDEEDKAEQAATRYILMQGAGPLLAAVLAVLLASPLRFLSALKLALKLGRRADRSMIHHLAYLAEACRMLPWLRESGVRHLHAHFGTNSTTVAMLAQALGGPPYSFTVHGPEEFDKPQFIGLDEKIRRAAFVVAISSYGRSQLYRWVGHAHWATIHVVHCGLEQAFHAVPPVPVPDVPRLVCVGRLCEQKGQLLLIEAVARLASKGVELELVLAGDGEMRDEIEALVARHALGDQVRITGWIDARQVREEILNARGLVLPSFAEGLPVVIMEAMALRRPVLSTYVAGIPELVRHGQEGWLFPAGSVEELASAIESFLACPAEELARMGEVGYQRVMARHDIDIEAAKLSELFRRSSS
jgi:glycosyltransferase involved in cell wall biosynthesis